VPLLLRIAHCVFLTFAFAFDEYCVGVFDPHVRSAFVWAAFFPGFRVDVTLVDSTRSFVSGLSRQ